MAQVGKFEVGDLVRLRTGKKPLQVVRVGRSRGGDVVVQAVYLSSMVHTNPSDYACRPRPEADFIHFNETENDDMAKLYEIKNADGSVAFGTLLAQNSLGQLVLEIKGTGEVGAYAPDRVQEVVPYTVQVRILDAEARRGPSPHYLTTPGTLVKGDFLLMSDGTFGRVVAVDTKNRDAQSLKNARKVVTEPVTEVASASPAPDADDL
jgi:hypothetical protein